MKYIERPLDTSVEEIVNGVSYIGAPKPNTAMFVSKKAGHLLSALRGVHNCVVFAETGLDVPADILENNTFVFSSNPQGEYAALTAQLFSKEESINAKIGFNTLSNGALISQTAQIGDNSLIEPGVIIGPGVVVGNNARIYSGAVIKNAIIGNDVLINEKAVIGSNGFTMARDTNGNLIRIHSLGKVIIGDNVEIGAHDNISRGSGGNTVIEDYAKIDALVHLGHDVHISKNVEVTAGAIVGGFVEVGEDAYIGINAVIRNRKELGERSYVGMGSTVVKSIEKGITVVGNPAKPFVKNTEV